MLGIILSLLVAFLKALGEYAGKIFTASKTKNNIDEYTLALGGRLMGAVIVFPLLFFIPLNVPEGNFIYILLVSASLNAIATVTTLKALKHGELSVVGPLSALTIPFLLFTGYFIAGEFPNIYGVVGVLCIFLGTYFLGISQEENEGFFGPMRGLLQNIGARYMILTACIWSITGPLDKLGINEYGVLLWMLYVNIAIALCMLSYLLIFRKKSFSGITKKTSLKKISCITLLGACMLLVQMIATKLTLVIYVISIKRASGIFSVLLGYLYFDEKNIQWKLFATSLMIVGVIIIILGGNI